MTLHIFKMVMWFRHIDFSSGYPLVNVDYIQYYARALRGDVFLRQAGRLWGYDPYESAGTLSGFFNEVGNYLINVVCHFLSPFISIANSLLFIEIISWALIPFSILFIVRNWGGRWSEAWIGFGLVTAALGCLDPFSALFVRVGLFGYFMGSFLAVWCVSCLWRYFQFQRVGDVLAAIILASLALQFHPATILVMGPAVLFFYATSFFSLSIKQHSILWVAAVAVLAINFYWMIPFVIFSNWRSSAAYFVTKGFFSLSIFNLPEKIGALQIAQGIFHVLLAGFLFSALRGRRSLLWVWIASLVFLVTYGSQTPWVQTLQPGRNIVPLFLAIYSMVPLGLSIFVGNTKSILLKFVAVGGGLCLLLFVAIYPPMYDRHFSTNFSPDQIAVVNFFRSRPPLPGRVLFEGVDIGVPHVVDVLPSLCKQSFLGGPHPGNHMATKFTVFSGEYVENNSFYKDRPRAFGKYLVEMGEPLFSTYLTLYNVHEVWVRSHVAMNLLDGYKETLASVGSIGNYRVFRVLNPSSWFEVGYGQVFFDYDRIVVENASRGSLVLKFHWIKTFKTNPPLPIEPIFIKDDPIPFIKIDNAAGVKQIEIFNAGL